MKFILSSTAKEKIFCTKCGENKQDVIFTCTGHIPFIILAVETSQSFYDQTSYYFRDEIKTYCPICVKICLRQMYYYFKHVNFQKN